MSRKRTILLIVIALLALVLVTTASAEVSVTDGDNGQPNASHRLIVQLESPSLAEWATSSEIGAAANLMVDGRLNVQADAAQGYIRQLKAEQAAFTADLAAAIPGAQVTSFVDGTGASAPLTYQTVLNGVVLELPKVTPESIRAVAKLPGVKQVLRDYEQKPAMYASIPLIGAPTLWDQLGGQGMSGEGIIVASIDSGVYAPNPFFDPTGFAYPAGYPVGDTSVTTEKVIGARAYFRHWDPPPPADAGTLPGPTSSSHGTHTIGTTAGNANTEASLAGYSQTISGVAPRAQVLSYRVFYPSYSEYSGSAFDAEIVKAYEDAVIDGAHVINYSAGGYDGVMPWASATNLAREAAWDAGVFVSHSAGNEGPGSGSASGHSQKIMEVAASTTSGTIASGVFKVTAPEPVPAELQDIAFASSSFGAPLPVGTIVGPYVFLPGIAVDPANFEGCDPWPAGTFDGVAALISRGACEFGVKVLNAEQAGAEFVVVYNHAAGGEGLVSMAPGAVGNQVTISSVFVGHTNGLALVDWYDVNGAASQFALDTLGYQAGNVPDVIASFSSRGPAHSSLIGPDVTAPGVNILSAGYGSGSGLDQHMGFGQVSGTSMAAPHVAGAAALLKQMHPDWTPSQIMSALMSTSTTEVWLDSNQTVPATVLDMGAGRIDLTKAGDPGLIFDYPSLSLGSRHDMMTVMATDVSGMGGTYDLSVMADAGVDVSVDPASLTFAAGETKSFEVMVDTSGAEVGDYGGFVYLSEQKEPAARVRVAHASPDAPAVDILVNDAVALSDIAFKEITGYAELPAGTYNIKVVPAGATEPVVIEADLDLAAGTDYTVAAINVLADIEPLVLVDDNSDPMEGKAHARFVHASADAPPVDIAVVDGPVLFPDVAFGEASDYLPVDAGTYDLEVRLAGSDTVVLTLPGIPLEEGVVYTVWAMGLVTGSGDQALTAVLGVDNDVPPSMPHMAHLPLWVRVEAEADAQVLLVDNDFSDLLGYPDYAGYYTDALTVLGWDFDYYNADLNYNNPQTLPSAAELAAYDVIVYWSGDNYDPDGTFTVATPLTVIDMQVLSDWMFNGGRFFAAGQDLASAWDATASDGAGYFLYAANLGAQYLQDSMFDPGYAGMLPPMPSVVGQPGSPFSGLVLDLSDAGDGAANQYYVDEISTAAFGDTGALETIAPVLAAVDGYAMDAGHVGMARAAYPTLEEPLPPYDYRSLYLSFGLEGVNNDTGYNTREDLLGGAMAWLLDSNMVTVHSGLMDVDSIGVSYRWDFGDGSPYSDASPSNQAGHRFDAAGTYTVRVEAMNGMGATELGMMDVEITEDMVGQVQYFTAEMVSTYVAPDPLPAPITIGLPLMADTWVNGGDTGANFDEYAATVARSTGLDNALLTFDRSALPEGVEILSAELMINTTFESGAFGKELTVLNTEAFDSTTVTFDTTPAIYNPGDAVPVTIGTMSFDVAFNVAAWDAVGAQATDDSHVGQLAISATGPWGRVVFDSLETYQAKPAMLVVTYRPAE